MMETEIAVGSDLRITCERAAFVDALSTVARAVSSRTNVHVLAGVLVQPAGDGLELAATDMELSLRTHVAAQVEGDGAVVVPGRLLTDVARLLPDDSLTLAYRPEDGVAELTSGPYQSRLNVYDPADFPRLPTVDVPLQEIEAAKLLGTIERVARAASRDESRPVLTGMLVRFEGATLVMAATDSYRLAVQETELGSPGPQLEAIIPARALSELARLAGGHDTISIGVNENHVIFGAGDVWLTTRRIDGQFPNYKQLLPETFEAELELPREELRGIVKRAAVMAQRNTPLRLRFAEGELTISARSQDVGETSESMPAPYTGEPLEIGFNAEFLADGLESVSGDTVHLKLINPLRPGLLSAPGETFWYLIMPIRLAG
ncbi:MAG TPA: DNA polymerase III subunit beta [Gaiellaceae bacterium]|jgi:DNA polymerase-3 subunit beta|nr:DNA polymerase III subunit beta [Gaiellaceae bacterium]